MARKGINKVTILGNLGQDPEVRYAQGGAAITTISVATSESWKDKDGNQQDRTEWHRIKFFGKLAEIAGEYLKKGRQVYVEGSLRTEKYTDKSGVEKYATDIIATEMQLIGGAERGGANGGGNDDRSQDQHQEPRSNQGQARGGYAQGGQQRHEESNAHDPHDIPW